MGKVEQLVGIKSILKPEDLGLLITILQDRGYTVIGPSLQQGAIGYHELKSVNELPAGWTDQQEGGSYRLVKRNDDAWFGYNVGPHSWKNYLFPPSLRLWQANRKGKGFEINSDPDTPEPKYAFFGVRSCEIHAIQIQDKVFLQGKHIDPAYLARRENNLIIAVNCGQAGGTCFCTSMNTGPKVTAGFDLSLTEIMDAGEHYFVTETGSETGAEILALLPTVSAGQREIELADALVAHTARSMGRVMETKGIKELLCDSFSSDRWNDIADRCLSCGNCTLVCPTCFCSTTEDVTDLTGEHTERWRKWDSCFNIEFSYIHGGSVRTSVQSRYRQWITHKLSTWIDQFGVSGCVGCGRCITWCPVAIDITAEVHAFQQLKDQLTVQAGPTGNSNLI